MVELYLKKIKSDDITLDDIPKLWRQKVMDRLIEDGYTLNEDGSVVKEQVDWSEGKYQHPVYKVVNRATESIVEVEI